MLGSQSAGKSSLIESISTVGYAALVHFAVVDRLLHRSLFLEPVELVPGAFAYPTCRTTYLIHIHFRCPTECTLNHSDEPWRCDVYLRFKYDSQNQPLIGGQRPDIPFGGPVYSPEDVTDRVRRAQFAILNPNLDSPDFPRSFLTSEPPTHSEITFSRNIVVLKVSGPDIVDLSFVDLPGTS